MGKNVYTSEIKWAVVKEKMSGQLTTKEIMEKYGIKNKSQIETWRRWYRANEIHRFDQPIGFGIGPLVGGVLTEFFGWRYLFGVSLLSIIGLPFYFRLLPLEKWEKKGFDYVGMLNFS
ncbi:helix-turn-helix domain-containing protein [Psychrobacillus sp. NPDC096426]|uniref:helix-turn-helix domain-containing protein n=1 Tax=Psychrobacillus sp. NPDC096426 TaxID=3364491 RepID=UPI0038242EC6